MPIYIQDSRAMEGEADNIMDPAVRGHACRDGGVDYLLIALFAGFRKKSTLIQSLNFDRV